MINGVWPARFVVPDRGGGDAEGIVDRGSHVFRRVGARGGIRSEAIGRTDHLAAFDAAAGKKDGLHRTPMIAAWLPIRTGQRADSWRAAEFAGHNNQRVI